MFRIVALPAPLVRLSLLVFVLASLLLPSAARAQVTFPAQITMNTIGYNTSHLWGVAVDRSGNVYSFYFSDVVYGGGTVVEFLAAGGYTTSMDLASDFSNPEGVAVDANGNVFVADTGHSAVKEILAVDGKIPETNPTINTLGSGFSRPEGIAVDGSGNVFVTEAGGVKEILAVNGSIPAANPTINTLGSGFSSPEGVAVDASGNVYIADSGNSAVKEILAVNGSIPATGATIKTLGSGFELPVGVAVDASGNVYVTDYDNGTAKEILAVNGSIPATNPTINTLDSSFTYPAGVAVDASGSVYVADTYYTRIVKLTVPRVDFGDQAIGKSGVPISLPFTIASNSTTPVDSIAVLTTGNAGKDFAIAAGSTCTATTYSSHTKCVVNVAFTPLAAGLRRGAVVFSYKGYQLATVPIYGVGTGPQVTFLPGVQSALGGGFSRPYGVAVDASGNIFVADDGNNAVKEIPAAGGYATVNSLGSGLYYPSGVAVDGSGNLFVVDTDYDAVEEILAAGGYTTVNSLGNGLYAPSGVAVDGSGNIYVADTGNNTVEEILAAGGYTTVNTLGKGFDSPRGVAVDASGNVFVADTGNLAMKEILAVGGSITAGAKIKTLGSGFSYPQGVAVDASGNVYVADTFNDAVKEILAVGNYATVNTLASGFSSPTGVAVDGNGNVYVTDTDNSRVVKLDYADAPSLSFPTQTLVGSTDTTDGAMTVGIANIGNQPLIFTTVTRGSNPLYPVNFPENTGDIDLCSAGTPLDPGAICDVSVNFAPNGVINTGSVMLADNALNQTGAKQYIALSGTGIVQSSQTITVTAITGTQYALTSVSLSATANSGLAVSFASITPTVCTVAGTTASLLIPGTCTIQATQAGDNYYTAAPAVSYNFLVSLAAQSITFPAITATEYAATTLGLTATASSGLTVSFTSSTPTVCTVTGSTASLLISGTCSLKATQAGNSTYPAATPVYHSFWVGHTPQTITFPAITGTQVAGTSVSLSASANTGLIVTLTSLTPAVCTVSGSTASLLISGTCIIQATQVGSAVYVAAVPVNHSFWVSHATQTITFPAITGTQVALSSINLLATASSALTVSFTSLTPTVCTVSGSTASLLTSGTCTIQATQAGNSSDSAAASVYHSFWVSHATQTITFPAITGAQVALTNVNLSATASSGLAVSYTSQTPTVCTVTSNGASLLAGGACTIKAAQAGDTAYSAAANVSQSFAVTAQ